MCFYLWMVNNLVYKTRQTKVEAHISERVVIPTPTISGWVHKSAQLCLKKHPQRAHYGELSKFRDFVGRNKAPLWMEKVLFWTSLGGISSHYNAFSFLDPNFKSSTLPTPST
jgi:hypothetical protein